MTERDVRVDRIGEQLERMHPAQVNFGSIAREMEQLQRDPANWQRERQRINDRVDMRALGLPGNDDFQILGVDSRGRVQSQSTDGVQQLRDRNTLQLVNNDGRRPSPSEARGPREFTPNADGSVQYTIRPGDTVSHVAQERLRQELQRNPSTQEIYQAVEGYRRANNISDINNVPVGRSMRLPPAAEALARRNESPRTDLPPTAQGLGQGLRPGDGSLRPTSDNYHPVAPPGMSGSNAGRWSERERTNVNAYDEGNRQVTNYDTWVGHSIGTWNNARVRQETEAGTGVLLRSRVDYDGTGINYTVRTGNGGSQTLENVRTVETVRSANGSYITQITFNNGARSQFTTARGGEVSQGRQIPSTRPQTQSDPYGGWTPMA